MWFGSSRALIARGLITIAFGVLLIGWPALSLAVLVLLFGAFALVDGALVFTIGLQMPSGAPARSLALVAGALAVVLGVVTFLWPGITEMVLLVLIAFRAILIGGVEVAAAAQIRHSSGTWWLASVGLLSIVFGVALLAYPQIGLLALVWAIGLYTIVIGCATTARAWVLATSHA